MAKQVIKPSQHIHVDDFCGTETKIDTLDFKDLARFKNGNLYPDSHQFNLK